MTALLTMTDHQWRKQIDRERYDSMLIDLAAVQLDHCWACGRGQRDRPQDWHAPWLIHRAHVVSKPRRADRRAIVLLCALCHMGGVHHERIITSEREYQWPKLERAHLLWLKIQLDRKFYDRAFLQANAIAILPAMRKPPKVYLDSYAARRAS